MNFRRLKQVCKYGWQDAKAISQEPEVNKGHLAIFGDILHCFLKYNVWSNQYKKEKLYSLCEKERMEICQIIKEKNSFRDKWVQQYFNDYRFLIKWGSKEFEKSAFLQQKRIKAYCNRFNIGTNCFIGYGVILLKHHFQNASFSVGCDCLIAEDVNIDYTGGISIGDRVAISEGTKILSHNHDLNGDAVGESKRECQLSPLVIHDNVWIGARALILPGVSEIGRGAMIGAGAVIKNRIPPYAIVTGNPGKIVGFSSTPDEVETIEMNLPIEKKTDLETYRRMYDKYFINRIDMIKTLNSN